jgi:hypothetical protein
MLLVSYRPLAPLGFCACLLLSLEPLVKSAFATPQHCIFFSLHNCVQKFDASESASCRFGLAH